MKAQLGIYEKAMPNTLSYAQKLAGAKQAGFDYMEISVDESDEKLARLHMSQSERRDLVNLMFDTGIDIKSMCLSGHRKYPLGSANTPTVVRSMDIMHRAVDLASDLGIRIIQLAGYDVYYEESNADTRERFLLNLQHCVTIAARQGVLLAFETMENEFMDTIKKSLAIVQAINSPYLQIYPDIGNLTNAAVKYGHDVLGDIASGNGHIAAIHLKETVPGRYRELDFGTGHVNFSACVSVARRMGIGLFVAESWHLGEANWQEKIVTIHNFLRPILQVGE